MKDFKRNVNQALAGTSRAQQNDESKNETKKAKTEPKKKVGRPATKPPSRNINVAIPISLLNELHEKRGQYGLNMTQYIIGLIKNDLNN